MYKVTLRRKPINNGKESLYLDFYPAWTNPATGKPTRTQFLKMSIPSDVSEIKKLIKEAKRLGKDTKALLLRLEGLKPLTAEQKASNKEAMRLGESIRSKRENELNKSEIYTDFEKEQLLIKENLEKDFVEYFKIQMNKKKTLSTRQVWKSTLRFLEEWSGGHITFKEFTIFKAEDFKDFLLTSKSMKSDKVILGQNSARGYFQKVKATLKQAFRDGILTEDINSRIKGIEEKETRREFLSLEELNSLAATPCKNPQLKSVALYSALTGMAFQEIKNMIWSDVSYQDGSGYMVLTKRQKTKRDNYLPISDQAYSILGEEGEPNSKVFKGLNYSAYQNKILHQWIADAGITKEIKFHCLRHTFSVLQLLGGTDITTVSKMLGHKNLKTTMIYAKVVDESKREAANKIQIKL